MKWSLWPVAFPRNLFYYFQKQLYADVLQNSVIRNFAIFTGKHLFWRVFLIKLQALRPATLFNLVLKDTSTQVTPVKSPYEQLFLWNTSGGCFCQFEVTASWWASINPLFLIKNKICWMVSTRKVCGSVQKLLFTHY